MSLTGKEEYHRTIGIVHNLIQTVQVGEQQVSTLVGSKAAAEADDQCVGVEALNEFHDACGITLILQPGLLELYLDIFKQLSLQSLAGSPNLLIGTVVDAVPDIFVRLVAHKALVEVLAIDGTPLGSSPGGEVDTVGDIAHVVL